MDPITLGLASAGGGLVTGLLDARNQKKQAKAENRARQAAIAYLTQAMNQGASSMYGGYADQNSMTTGNSMQDEMLKALASRVQGNEIQAAAINNAIANRTNAEARADALRRGSLMQQAAGKNALAQSSINARRYNMNASDVYNNNARRNATGYQNLLSAVNGVSNDNLNRIGASTNMNTGSIADQNRQQTAMNYNNIQNRNAGYKNQIASLMGQPKQTSPSTGNNMLMGLTSGAMNGFNTIAQMDMLKALRG